jgi:AcrR family transcriptional regulator
MATHTDPDQATRTRLSRERVLRAAVGLADDQGIESVSMRKLAQELGVDPMSLYNHVANKEDLLDGMVDLVIGEIDPGPSDGDWKTVLRARAMAARETLLRHRWATRVHFEAVAGILRDGGFSVDLMHHALHVLGSRMLGFTQELFDVAGPLAEGPEVLALTARRMAGEFPHLSEMLLQISHDEATVVGSGCDDQLEFAFALDLILDGLERLRDA